MADYYLIGILSILILSTNCLQDFSFEKSRDEHYQFCNDNETVRIEMPKKGLVVKFNNGKNQFKVPFTIYANFESILEPVEDGPDQRAHSPRLLTITFLLGFAFIVSLLTRMLRTH